MSWTLQYGVFLRQCGLHGKTYRGQTAGRRLCWCWAVLWSGNTNKADNQKKIKMLLAFNKEFSFKLSAIASFFSPSRMMMVCLWICVSVSGRAHTMCACCSWWKSGQAAASNTWKCDRRKRGLSEADTDWRRSTAARRLLFATAEYTAWNQLCKARRTAWKSLISSYESLCVCVPPSAAGVLVLLGFAWGKRNPQSSILFSSFQSSLGAVLLLL